MLVANGAWPPASLGPLVGYRPLYATAIGTGMRQGELLGLRWQDVAEDYCALTVHHTLDVTRSLAEPKTATSRRTLRLGRSTSATLREQRRRQLEQRLAAGRRWRDTGHVFTTTVGTPLDGPTVTRVPDRPPRGWPSPPALPRSPTCHRDPAPRGRRGTGVVSRLLGHSTVSLTMDTYSHLTDRMTARAAERIDAILGTG